MHLHPAARIGALAVAAAATALVTGCSGSTSGGTHGSGKPATAALTAAQVMKNVSSQAGRATSAVVIMNTQITGTMQSSMRGVMKIRTRPNVAMEMNMTKISTNGQTVPGGMREILTGKAIYIKMQALARLSNKPWVVISTSKNSGAVGSMMAGLTQQIRQQDPLSAARMLAASKDVKAAGTATIDGVRTTHFHGTYTSSEAFSLLTPQLKKLMRQYASALGMGAITFDAWVDDQGNLREIVESYDAKAVGHVNVSLRYTSINQPVTIKPPPSSQVSTIPGLG
ncbi:MAG: hypothetical protein ACM3ML_06600 [Micromonosporaceae bacterium]